MTVLPAAAAARAQGTSHRILDELQSVHANSVPGPVVSTPDGGTMFVAEAGVIAVVDANSAFHFEEWVAPKSISDDLSCNLFGLAIDSAQWQDSSGSRSEAYVYVAVARVGIEVLRFVPSNPAGQRLEPIQRIEVPSGMAGIKIRGADPNERTLLVGDSNAGIRTFRYGG